MGYYLLSWQKSLMPACLPDSSAGKESACNAGDPGSIPGSESSPGEGVGYPPQYSWASLVAQVIKNPPAMQETWVGKSPWRRAWQPTPVFLPGEPHGHRSLAGCSPRGRSEPDTTEWLHFIFLYGLCKTKYFIWCEYCDPSFLVIFVCMK